MAHGPPLAVNLAELARGARLAAIGLLTNAVLAAIKGVAGVLGHSYALLADAAESAADVGGSLAVWSGLRVSARDADHDHPYGHGKAEPLSASVVGLMLCGAAILISIRGIEQIITPSRTPAPFTLIVLVAVVVVKELLARRVFAVARDTGSNAVAADAHHHRADVITSLAAFTGISATLLGGPRWAWCDGAAAVLASLVVGINGLRILRPAVHELMDGAPDPELLGQVHRAAEAVDGVRGLEKLMARKVGAIYLVDLHVQADAEMSLHDAHILSGCVKSAIRTAVPRVANVLVHMEPFEPGSAS